MQMLQLQVSCFFLFLDFFKTKFCVFLENLTFIVTFFVVSEKVFFKLEDKREHVYFLPYSYFSCLEFVCLHEASLYSYESACKIINFNHKNACVGWHAFSLRGRDIKVL